jgi:hypothetical protein
MTTKPNAAAFLANMNLPAAEAAENTVPKSEARPKRAAKVVRPLAGVKSAAARRSDQKHIGGYFDTDTVEKVAILRARLKLDNSGLIKLAIDELFTKQKTARAFSS